MPSELVFIRWENTTPPHYKFYEVEVELSLFYPKTLVRRWGRIGTRRPRSIQMVMAGPAELERQVARIARWRASPGGAHRQAPAATWVSYGERNSDSGYRSISGLKTDSVNQAFHGASHTSLDPPPRWSFITLKQRRCVGPR